MTRGICDTLEIYGEKAPIVRKTNERTFRSFGHDGLFDIKTLPEPKTISTGCWHGYVCEYEIEDEHLFLARVLDVNGSKLPEVLRRPMLFSDSLFIVLRESRYREVREVEFCDGRVISSWAFTGKNLDLLRNRARVLH